MKCFWILHTWNKWKYQTTITRYWHKEDGGGVHSKHKQYKRCCRKCGAEQFKKVRI